MFEKVNPSHPDKVADRIAGAIVDLAYIANKSPKIAVEVLAGHGGCTCYVETSLTRMELRKEHILQTIQRISPDIHEELCHITIVAQDKHLADNQQGAVRCGDNGIFKGTPVTPEQALLAEISNYIYGKCKSDGKYIYDQERNRLIVCQSYLPESGSTALSIDLQRIFHVDEVIINPLGEWTGGLHTDCGATNRKLGSDMGDSVTGGGLHGKDLSKADVSVNVVCFMRAQETGEEVTAYTAIGDDEVTFHYANGTHETQPYEEVVRIAREYIKNTYGSFECFAEHGLVYYGINGK